MLKSDKPGDLKPRLSLNLKCRDCIHFKRGPAFFEKKCKDLGILPGARACQAFTPDVYKLSKVKTNLIYSLGDIAKDFGESQLRILSFIFRNAALLKKNKLRFGQPVYINLSSPSVEYVDSYYKGYVLGISKNGDQVFITSSLKKTEGKNVFLSVLPSSILTVSKFKKRLKKLKKLDRVKLPEKYIETNLEEKPIVFNRTSESVPTLDTAPPEWFNTFSQKKGDNKWHVKRKKMTNKVRKGRTRIFNVSKGR